MPIQCQCKWPFRSYSGNKLSTGTHHWSRRRMIWVNQFPIRHYTNPLQCQSWSTQFQSCVNPGQSSVNTPQFRYQSGRHLGQSIANPLSVPDKSAHVWPTHQSNANIGLICQSWVNPPIQCQSNTNPPIHYQSANPIPIRQSNTNLPMHYQSANPIPICQSNTNPRLNRQSITNMPIHYQSANPLPICQYITNPPIQYQSVANLSIHYQFANLWPIYQSQTNPFILCQRSTRLTWQSSNHSPSTHTHTHLPQPSKLHCHQLNRQYLSIPCQCIWPFRIYTGNKISMLDPPLVSTVDDFTAIPVANLHSLFQSTNPMPIYWTSVNPTLTHKYKSITHPPSKCQCYKKLPIHYQSTNQCTYPLNQSNPLVLDHPANSPTQCQSEAYLTILVRQPSNPIKTESAS